MTSGLYFKKYVPLMGKQEYVCVKCCECLAFQVQIVKKQSNFTCSVCHSKQSILRVFARSNKAKDVREVVQNYNSAYASFEKQRTIQDENDETSEYYSETITGVAAQVPDRKWSAFLEEDVQKWTVALPRRDPDARGTKRAADNCANLVEEGWDVTSKATQHQRRTTKQLTASVGAVQNRQFLPAITADPNPASEQLVYQNVYGSNSASGVGRRSASLPDLQDGLLDKTVSHSKWSHFLLEDD